MYAHIFCCFFKWGSLEPKTFQQQCANMEPRSGVLIPLLNKDQDSLEKWLVIKMEEEIFKMSQECLVLPKINEVLKRSDISPMGVCQKETGGNKIGQWTKPKNKKPKTK